MQVTLNGGEEMKRKIIWLLLICMILATLLATSCRPAEEEKEEIIVIPPEEKEPGHEEVFTVGEPVEPSMFTVPVSRNIAVTVTELYMVDSYEYESYMDDEFRTHAASFGNTFIIAFVNIKNISDTDTFKVGTQYMRGGCADKVAPAGFYMTGKLRDELGVWLDIPPGEEMKGPVLFEVPKDSTDYYIKYRFSDDPEVWAKWMVE